MATTPTKVVTVAQMQALEAVSERLGVSTDTLMENAGLACAEFIRKHMGGAAGRSVLLLIGPGNNGADGPGDRPAICGAGVPRCAAT